MIVVRAVNVFISHLLSVVQRFIDLGDEYVVEVYRSLDANEIRIELELKEETRFESVSHSIQDELRKKLILGIGVVKVKKGDISRCGCKTKPIRRQKKRGSAGGLEQDRQRVDSGLERRRV